MSFHWSTCASWHRLSPGGIVKTLETCEVLLSGFLIGRELFPWLLLQAKLGLMEAEKGEEEGETKYLQGLELGLKEWEKVK